MSYFAFTSINYFSFLNVKMLKKKIDIFRNDAL
jgi:hypothetical protein